ncbi:hypothetical protein [Streptomyces sp. NPDC059957]|uniref:hypothetical protein n=1 Tax=Streptomyces sp. NPDC059957 TaxID=3347016 RepID=UPI003654CF2B
MAVLTLCAGACSGDSATSLESLTDALEGIGAGPGSLVLDLDHAPFPVPADALAAIDARAAKLKMTVVALAPSRQRAGSQQVAPALRLAPAGRVAARGAADGEAALARELYRALGDGVLIHRAAGIRTARRRAHPCS